VVLRRVSFERQRAEPDRPFALRTWRLSSPGRCRA
jgi:hypothetical protein